MALRILVALGFALAGLVGGLLLWSQPLEPVAWTLPQVPSVSGPYAPNHELARGRRLLAGVGVGPEDVAIDAAGRLYTGFEDGRIVRLAPGSDAPETFADTGGRPLGLVFDGAGRLVVADALRGLLAVAPDGALEVLATEVAGTPIHFANGVDVAPDGTVYFSDASTKYGYGEAWGDLLEHGGHGRLLAYDPYARRARVVLDGLQFANGVAVADDGAYVLVAESHAFRIRRVWLTGERAGRVETFAENLLGSPDNLHLGRHGTVWVGLPALRSPALDALAPRPMLRRLVWHLPEPDPARYGLVAKLDAEGRLVRTLQDPSGSVAFVTAALERDGVLYLGSHRGDALVAVTLDP